MQQIQSRLLCREEILAMEHPLYINVDDIISASQTGATTVYLMKTIIKALSPEELERRRRHFAQTSWQIVQNLRMQGIDV